MFDVVVVGGGPAGLSASLMLGRCRRRVLLCDTAEPRNRFSAALHGYLTRDGIDPSQFNELGRAELTRYGVECRKIAVAAAERRPDGFDVRLADGRIERTRFLLIATGVVDDIPEVPGARECYGRSLFHCPYCDGWERREQRLAVFGKGVSGVKLALSLKTWGRSVVLCTDGTRIIAAGRGRLARNGVELTTAKIARLDHQSGQVGAIVFASGDPLPVDAIFFTTGQHPQCDLAVTLGCAFNRRGTVDTGNLSETNVPGVFVAGDASRDAQFVVVAAAEGVKAALAINQTLQRQELVA